MGPFERLIERLLKFDAQVTLQVGDRDDSPDDPDYDAQQAWLDRNPERVSRNARLYDLRITKGAVDRDGVPIN